MNRVVAYESTLADKSMFKVVKKRIFQECYSGVFMLYIFPAAIVFCKMSIFLLSSLPNVIIDSESRWIGGSVGKWSVVGCLVVSMVRRFSKTQKKTCLG